MAGKCEAVSRHALRSHDNTKRIEIRRITKTTSWSRATRIDFANTPPRTTRSHDVFKVDYFKPTQVVHLTMLVWTQLMLNNLHQNDNSERQPSFQSLGLICHASRATYDLDTPMKLYSFPSDLTTPDWCVSPSLTLHPSPSIPRRHGLHRSNPAQAPQHCDKLEVTQYLHH